MTSAGQTFTSLGALSCSYVDGVKAHRIGFRPAPWEWTPWEYATGGRFTGRWDDPGGVWRTLYVGSARLACYLEVLAYARPCPDMVADLDDIEVDDEDQFEFPTIAPGELPLSWCAPRMTAAAALIGWFVVPGDVESVAALRKGFRGTAFRLGLADLDGAAIRDGKPRELTQVISQWINTLNGPDGKPIAGIEFDSRHGDGLRLWALYEHPGDPVISPFITPLDNAPVDARDPALVEAMRLLDLVWVDR